ncbi:MAG TPA: polymer-forming cytoskeletal protein [Allosphingosinicella sp.]|nr:polymer-forming cytoskeletal protein [Allosphingosinicella sp.]
MFWRGRVAGREGGEISLVGAEVTVTGDIDTPGRLHIAGKVTGDIRCGTLTQSDSGVVHGNITATEAKLAGLIDGAVEAGSLVLEASARVTGDVLYESLSVAAGAEVEGRFKRRRGTGDGAVHAKAEASAKPPRSPRIAAAKAAPVPAAPLFEAPAAEAAE